jgi:hypothetical protein
MFFLGQYVNGNRHVSYIFTCEYEIFFCFASDDFVLFRGRAGDG